MNFQSIPPIECNRLEPCQLYAGERGVRPSKILLGLLLILVFFEASSGQSSPEPQTAVRTQIERGLKLGKAGNWKAAAEELQEAVAADPNSAEAHFSLGVALYWTENWSDAVGHLKQAVKVQPDLGEAYFFLGHSFWKLDRLEEASLAFQLALDHGADLPRVYDDFGQLLLERGEYEESRILFQKALQ